MRRHRLLTRAVPLVVLAAIALAVGIVIATASGEAERALVTRYVRAWVRHDYATMYSLLAPASRARLSEAGMIAVYRQAAATATLTALQVRRVEHRRGQVVPVRMQVRTRLFGTLAETLLVPLAGSGAGARVRFSGELLLPGLRPGERLTSRLALPPRASLLASDNLVSTVSGLVTKYRTRTGVEREFKRYERRGATARNRLERQVRRTRTRFERQLRQRRGLVERTVRQNRRRFEREVRSVRRDVEKRSGIVGSRVEKLVADAQGLVS